MKAPNVLQESLRNHLGIVWDAVKHEMVIVIVLALLTMPVTMAMTVAMTKAMTMAMTGHGFFTTAMTMT